MDLVDGFTHAPTRDWRRACRPDEDIPSETRAETDGEPVDCPACPALAGAPSGA